VLAEGAQHDLRLGGQLDRLAERLRKLLDPEPPALIGGQWYRFVSIGSGSSYPCSIPFEPGL